MNNISFKSKINFVDNRQFLKQTKRGNFIDYFKDDINLLEKDEFYTERVRSCTAGGIIVPNQKALGFHIVDDLIIDDTPFKITTKPERALLLGSKSLNNAENSIYNFKIFKKFLEKHTDNITVFQEHKHEFSQSNLHYSLKNDTWTINTQFYDKNKYPHDEVLSLNDLLENFKKIRIAKGDRLFINNKEILPKECPKIFEEMREKNLINRILKMLKIRN